MTTSTTEQPDEPATAEPTATETGSRQVAQPDEAGAAVPAPARREPTRLREIVAGRYNGPTTTADMHRRATVLSKSRFAVPEDVRGNEGDILMYLEWAQALDIPIAVAFREIFFNFRGVAGIHAAFMHALLIRAGHNLEMLHLDGRKCVLRVKYADGRVSPQVSWHILEAQGAGLFTKKDSPWKNYGEDMLWARCVSRTCRRWAPDVTLGLHTPEELAEGISDDVDHLAPEEPELDPDGKPIVDSDVKAFLDSLEGLTADQLVHKHKEADHSGLLRLFAGRDERGLNQTVQEVIFDLGQAARQREVAAGTLTGGGIDPDETRHLDDMHQADEQDAAERLCCPPAYVLQHGNHRPQCPNFTPERRRS